MKGTCLRDVVDRLDLPANAICAVNGPLERNLDRLLQEGDGYRFMRPGAGG